MKKLIRLSDLIFLGACIIASILFVCGWIFIAGLNGFVVSTMFTSCFVAAILNAIINW